MRVTVYEPIGTGHRFAYLAHLLPEMSKLGVTPILVTTDQALNSPPYQTHLHKHLQHFEVDSELVLADKPSSHQLADGFEQCIRRLAPDHCLLPVGDMISQIIGARRWIGKLSPAQSVETEALHFRGRFGYSVASTRGRLKRFASRMTIAKAPWSRLFHLDAYQLAALCQNNRSLAARSFVMPDPVEIPPKLSKSEARNALGLPTDGRFVGCAGSIDLRKGADKLLRSFAEACPQLPTSDRLLLAGPVSPKVHTLLLKEFKALLDSRRIICLDRYLSVEEIAQALIAMDLVCTPYPEHSGSSSIVIRSAAVERPLLAADVNWIGRTVKQFQLGKAIDVTNQKQFANSIVDGLESSPDFSLSPSGKRFVKFHSGENFAATWLGRIRERLSLPQDDRQIHWESVITD